MKTLALMLVFAARLASAAPVELKDDTGQTLQFSGVPQRVVSLLPSLTESVCALGACARLVAVDRHSNWPAEVRQLPQLGGLDEVSVEQLLALKPDLVLLPPSMRLHTRLRALGLRVLAIDSLTHADVRRSLLLLGRVLGADGERLWREIDATLQAAAAMVPPATRGATVYFEVDDAPYAAGASSFIGETLSRLGLKNIVPPEMGPFPRLNPEFIVRADPAWIMLGDRSLSGLAARPGWQRLNALRQQQVCSFSADDGDRLARPGPRMAEGAAVVLRCLQNRAERRAR